MAYYVIHFISVLYYSRKVNVTKDGLLRMFKHKVELKVWDTRDKVSVKARFDRPKAFRLPNTKGTDEVDLDVVRELLRKEGKTNVHLGCGMSMFPDAAARSGVIFSDRVIVNCCTYTFSLACGIQRAFSIFMFFGIHRQISSPPRLLENYFCRSTSVMHLMLLLSDF